MPRVPGVSSWHVARGGLDSWPKNAGGYARMPGSLGQSPSMGDVRRGRPLDGGQVRFLVPAGPTVEYTPWRHRNGGHSPPYHYCLRAGRCRDTVAFTCQSSPFCRRWGWLRAEQPPGVVINYIPSRTQVYIGSPGIAVLPNGDYLAKHDEFGPKSTEKTMPSRRSFGRSTAGCRGGTSPPSRACTGPASSSIRATRT